MKIFIIYLLFRFIFMLNGVLQLDLADHSTDWLIQCNAALESAEESLVSLPKGGGLTTAQFWVRSVLEQKVLRER